MSTQDLLQEISKLSPKDRMFLAEQIIRGLRAPESRIAQAAEMLKADYETEGDLRSLTDLDTEEFYETR
ncbi:MAG: hypothetical protein RI842_11315 [Schleiferiaceae bacterium]|nr:hypothetical protein [Schleiferiaceae bacterium]MDR9443296.1 hypothetical protein [Schleiferiaceae bacterium]